MEHGGVRSFVMLSSDDFAQTFAALTGVSLHPTTVADMQDVKDLQHQSLYEITIDDRTGIDVSKLIAICSQQVIFSDETLRDLADTVEDLIQFASPVSDAYEYLEYLQVVLKEVLSPTRRLSNHERRRIEGEIRDACRNLVELGA